LNLGLQLLLQVPHLLLVILNQVDQLEDLLARFLVSRLQMLYLLLAAPHLLPQVLILRPHHRILPVCLLCCHLIPKHHATVNNVLLEGVGGEHGIFLGPGPHHYGGRVPARAPPLRVLGRGTLGMHVISVGIPSKNDFQLGMKDLTHLFVGLCGMVTGGVSYLGMQGEQGEILEIVGCLLLKVEDVCEDTLEGRGLDRTYTGNGSGVIADSESVRLLFFHV
jgi:hypothetical protein